jgi:hypothetical protein
LVSTFSGLIACIFYKLFTSIEFYAGQLQEEEEGAGMVLYLRYSEFFFFAWI